MQTGLNTEQEQKYFEKIIQIRRVTKVVKGGKKLGFRVIVVVGDKNGKVGVGIGKAGEVALSIRKAIEKAKKSFVEIPIIGTTIAHEVEGKICASRVNIRPTRKGTGVIAGGIVRTILELSGVKDVVAKCIGSSSPVNSGKAALKALSKLMNEEEISQIRGKKLYIRYVN